MWSFGVVVWEIFSGGKVPWYMYANSEVRFFLYLKPCLVREQCCALLVLGPGTGESRRETIQAGKLSWIGLRSDARMLLYQIN